MSSLATWFIADMFALAISLFIVELWNSLSAKITHYQNSHLTVVRCAHEMAFDANLASLDFYFSALHFSLVEQDLIRQDLEDLVAPYRILADQSCPERAFLIPKTIRQDNSSGLLPGPNWVPSFELGEQPI